MFQGFYDLAANMITQNRKMNVISNNMANVSTPGFKSDKLIETTFRDEMIYRYDRDGKTPIGVTSRVNTVDERITDYTQGGVRATSNVLDFALNGNGFFAIQTGNGVVYSRNGSFSIDNERYLCLEGVGRVMGQNGPIQLPTDDITADERGNLYNAETGQRFDRLQVVDFADYGQLEKISGGVFRANGAAQEAQNTTVSQKSVEDSNVSMVDEMTAMMSGQRTIQSAAQLLKMYDQLTGKAVQTGTM